MHRTVVRAFVAAATLFVAVHQDAQSIMRRSAEGRNPIFVAAGDLYTSTGEFAPAVPESWRTRVQNNARLFAAAQNRSRQVAAHGQSEGACGGAYLAETDVESLVDRSTRASAIANAKAIFTGTVVTATPGLFDGAPGVLVELGEVRALKSSAAYANVRETLFVRHPTTYFRAGGIEFCRKASENDRPVAAGDRMLVFAFDVPADENGLFIYTFANDVIVEAREGGLRIPRLLSFFEGDGGDLDTVGAAIRRTIAGRRPEVRR
jgi:hypothetical protein